MVAGLCSLVVSSGALIAVGAVGDLMLPERLLLAAAGLVLASYGMLRYAYANLSVRIDISALGQIRVANAVPAGSANIPMFVPVKACLLRGTTLWSRLLLLRLRLDSGSVRTIAILPDSVPDDTFRALSVACRWISAGAGKPGSD